MKSNTLNKFSQVVRTFDKFARVGVTPTFSETEQINEVIQLIYDLHKDIGLEADRDYTVAEIDRLKTAIAWALEGNQ